MIWAEARGGAIGRGGVMPWHLPEDLAHFKAETMGLPVIMGRRTWESLPEAFRPLPGRRNVVVTRDPTFDAQGAIPASSLEAAFASATPAEVSGTAQSGTVRDGDAPSIWVMGGGQLYRAAMPHASELSVTRIDLDVPDADTFAPEIGPEWRLIESTEPAVSRAGLGYRFERYHRA